MANFQAGDVVMLKSGGPYMTVSFVEPGSPGNLECQWFDGPTLYQNVFRSSSVTAVPEPVAAPNDPEG